MRGKITDDNFFLQIKVSYHIFFFEVSTPITFFFPNSKTVCFVRVSPSFRKNENTSSTNILLVLKLRIKLLIFKARRPSRQHTCRCSGRHKPYYLSKRVPAPSPNLTTLLASATKRDMHSNLSRRSNSHTRLRFNNNSAGLPGGSTAQSTLYILMSYKPATYRNVFLLISLRFNRKILPLHRRRAFLHKVRINGDVFFLHLLI